MLILVRIARVAGYTAVPNWQPIGIDVLVETINNIKCLCVYISVDIVDIITSVLLTSFS